MRHIPTHDDQHPRSVGSSTVGAAIAGGVWVGLVVFRAIESGVLPSRSWVASEIGGHLGTYLYLATIGSLAFASFGWLMGHKQDELLERSLTDALTGLPNRRHLNQRLSAELARSHRVGSEMALLFVDLDRLKQVNDTSGHHAGDAALRAVAGAIRRACRSMDFAARYGGDEFVVLAPGTLASQAVEIGRRICNELPRSVEPRFAFLASRLSVSIGVADLDVAGTPLSSERILSAADLALYRAKSAGGGRIVAATRDDAQSEDPSREPGIGSVPTHAETAERPASSLGSGGVSSA